MRKSLNRRNLDELIKSNIEDLENNSKLLEQIEKKIETKHIEKFSKEMETVE
jgi:predicted Holliday junction resolvase-like endonuclease